PTLTSLARPPSPTDTYPLSLHDALPISSIPYPKSCGLYLWIKNNPVTSLSIPIDFEGSIEIFGCPLETIDLKNGVGNNFWSDSEDRKSTRLNSSHVKISYAVFCLKKET